MFGRIHHAQGDFLVLLANNKSVEDVSFREKLGGGFKHFFYTPIWHFEKYFSDGLKPPTRNVVVNEFKGQPEKQQKHEQTLNFKFEPLEVVFIRSYVFFWGGRVAFWSNTTRIDFKP